MVWVDGEGTDRMMRECGFCMEGRSDEDVVSRAGHRDLFLLLELVCDVDDPPLRVFYLREAQSLDVLMRMLTERDSLKRQAERVDEHPVRDVQDYRQDRRGPTPATAPSI